MRNFAWRTQTEYIERWETRCYDLERLISVDMIMSYWSRRTIAHMLVSFGFEDGEHVAFSVEIRRERHESYSEIGGFFKEFELSIIAADERDVVRLRTNVRGEDAYLYRVRMAVPAMRSLFLAYVDEANALVHAPRFYHTITGNCTTLVYQMMKRIVGHLPFDYRVLLSGYMPEYVYRVGGLDRHFPLEELRALGYISERARKPDRARRFQRTSAAACRPSKARSCETGRCIASSTRIARFHAPFSARTISLCSFAHAVRIESILPLPSRNAS